MRSLLVALGLLAWCAASRVIAAALPSEIDVPTMKTSIYVGSVTLSTGPFLLTSEEYVATYSAKVSPWAYWSETGSITVKIYLGDYQRLRRGETIELTGEATSKKGRPRHVTARVRPTDANSGKLKVRIDAGGTKLIFNGTYRMVESSAESTTSPPGP